MCALLQPLGKIASLTCDSAFALKEGYNMNEIVNTEPQITQDAPMETPIDIAHGIEKFTASDLSTLRSDLLQSGVDSFQAAELVTSFLSGRGYGISTDEARGVATKIEGFGCTVESIQEELERVAHFA
jgi:hypothetical protein